MGKAEWERQTKEMQKIVDVVEGKDNDRVYVSDETKEAVKSENGPLAQSLGAGVVDVSSREMMGKGEITQRTRVREGL